MGTIPTITPTGTMLVTRTEQRAYGEAMCAALKRIDKPGRNICSGKPRRYPSARKEKELMGLEPEERERRIQQMIAADFWPQCYAEDEAGIARRKAYPPPLSVLWSLEAERMAAESEWTEQTRRRNERDMAALLAIVDWADWREATPQAVRPILMEFSASRHASCESLIRRIFCRQMQLGVIDSDPWEHYPRPSRRSVPSRNVLLRRHIVPTVFTMGQLDAVIAYCFGHLGSPDGGKYLGVLMCATQGLDWPAICAPVFEDAKKAKYYPREVLQLTRQYVIPRGKKRPKLVDLPVDQVRTLSLSDMLAEAIRIRRAYVACKVGAKAVGELPMVCSERDIRRRINPEELKKWCARTLLQEVEALCQEGITAKNVLRIMRRTAKDNLRKAGYEEEELRYWLGLSPRLTSAKHYCDFAAEAEQDKLGEMQDIWLALYRVARQGQGRDAADRQVWAAAPGKRAMVVWNLDFSGVAPEGIPEEGVELWVVIPHGGDINIFQNLEERIKV